MLSRSFMTAAAAAPTNSAVQSSIISLTAPFTHASLATIRDALAEAGNADSITPDPAEPHAAVLVPLCNVNNTPGVLLEVRGKLRSHAGEVSFPGGRVDESDPSFLAAALRETQEEVGVPPRQIDILGQFGPAELSLRGLRVWPYVGFIRPPLNMPPSQTMESSTHSRSPHSISETRNTSPDMLDHTSRTSHTPLPSISLDSLTISQPEVATIFHLPLTALVSHQRLKPHRFRGGQYWAIDVSDLVPPDGPWASNDTRGQSEIASDGRGRLEVWGLTGWYLALLMKILRTYQ